MTESPTAVADPVTIEVNATKGVEVKPQVRLNCKQRPYIEPYVSPLKSMMQELPAGVSKEAARAALRSEVMDAMDAENDPDMKIAKAIQPKMKGWAWDRKTGAPIPFSAIHNTTALVSWASRQPGWAKSTANTMSPQDAYTSLTVQMSESSLDAGARSQKVRDFIATILPLLRSNDEPANAAA